MKSLLFILITLSFSLLAQNETVYDCENHSALEDRLRPGTSAQRVVVDHDQDVARVERRSMHPSSRWRVSHEIGVINSFRSKFRVYDFENKVSRTFAIKNGIGRELDDSAVLVYEYVDRSPDVYICSRN